MTDADPDANTQFVPLSAREGRSSLPSGPVEGTPEYLKGPLMAWFREAADLEIGLFDRVKLRLRVSEFSLAVLLDGVDALLNLLLPRTQADGHWNARFSQQWQRVQVMNTAVKLNDLLEDGGSVYRVRTAPGGLQRRVARAETAAFDSSIDEAEKSPQPAAAEDLEAAWRAAYGLHPNPSEAYRLAVRAVEHVAIPVVEPTSRRATLGTVRAALNVKPSKWHVHLGQEGDGEVELLVGQISLLWSGQVDRHGGQLDYAAATQRQAEEAVHMAVLLVRYFATGIVTLRNP